MPIQIGARFDPLTCSDTSAVLGSTGPHAFFRDFAGAPRTGTYYAVALADALTGTDLDPGNATILSFLAVSNRSYSVLGRTRADAGPWEKLLDLSAAPENRLIHITNLLGSEPQRFYRLILPARR